MNVLSLFDGMSCGQIALNRAGIKYNTYYASEIDKYAIKVTQANYPNTVQLGDITRIAGASLPKIDLLLGGSPCQGFSTMGKTAQFDDPRSQLFWEYVRLLKETQPRYFLLENVRMKKESQQVITDALGVEPVMIDSALVSAQGRKRWYWTNIPGVTQPIDKHISFESILCTTHPFLSAKVEKYVRSATYNSSRPVQISTKARTLLADGRTCYTKDGTFFFLLPVEWERLQTVPERYTAHVSDAQRKKMLGNGWTVDVIAHLFSSLQAAL